MSGRDLFCTHPNLDDASFQTDALEAFDNGTRYVGGSLDTAGIWATYPQDYLSTASGFGDQVRDVTARAMHIQ